MFKALPSDQWTVGLDGDVLQATKLHNLRLCQANTGSGPVLGVESISN